MPAITSIPVTLSDESTTVTFEPVSITGEKASFKGDDSAISNARSTLSLSLSPARKSRTSDQTNIRLDMPLTRVAADGVSETVEGEALVKIQIVEPDIMTDTERADLWAAVQGLTQDSLVSSYPVALNPAY